MHVTREKHKKDTVTGKMSRVGTGHTTQTGAGKHRHKCDRREGTRSQQTKRIVAEY